MREAQAGRTKPLIVSLDLPTHRPVQAFCKISEGLEEGVIGLAMEVVAACVARYLRLPVPTPYLVDLPAALVAAVGDRDLARRIRASSCVAFGSTFLPEPFAARPAGRMVSGPMLKIVLGVFVFDAVIGNADRRPGNPNC